MSNAVVFLFVLDTAQGLNETLGNQIFKTENMSSVKRCEPHSAESVILEVGKALDINMIPPWQVNVITPVDLSSEFYDSVMLSDTALPEFDQSLADDIDYLDGKLNAITSEEGTRQENAARRVILPVLPDETPFLAAIFETLSNVTALTCAGTLVSPYWVLTAANCVNMLGCSSSDSDNNEKSAVYSKYTIVVGTTNPVLDGLPYNVSQVIAPPEDASQKPSFSDSIVLLKTDSKMEFRNLVKYVKIATNYVEVSDVRVYGWMESQMQTEHSIGSVSSPLLRVLDEKRCQQTYNFTELICLQTPSVGNKPQMNPGGPALVLEGVEARILAVVLADYSAELGHYLVYPLRNHVHWLDMIIAQ